MKSKLTRMTAIFTVIIALPIVFAACGGGRTVIEDTTPIVKAKLQGFFRAANVFTQAPRPRQVAAVRNNPFAAYAQTLTATVPVTTGNLSGFCGSTAPFTITSIFGLGRWNDANCNLNINGFNPDDGAPLPDNITSIGNLKVVYSGDADDDNGGDVTIWLNDKPTAITVQLGKGSTDGKRHTITNSTAAVLVNPVTDVVHARITLRSGRYTSVRVLLGAQ